LSIKILYQNTNSSNENRKEGMKMRNDEDIDLSEFGGKLNVLRGERMSLGFCHWQLANSSKNTTINEQT